MDRITLINSLIKRFNFKSYLEIGVREGYTIHAVQCEKKISVDPCYECPNPSVPIDYKMTSDQFFVIQQKDIRFDIIFIDGDHTDQTTIRDGYNSLHHLSQCGIIVFHDCNPEKEENQTPVTTAPAWNGTVWRAIAHFRTNPNLSVMTIDSDSGLGVVKFGKQEPIKLPYSLDWNYFSQNRKRILNLISVSEFKSIYNL